MIISNDKIKRKFKRLNKDVARIDNSNDPRLRNSIHDKLIAENMPAVFYSRIILELCTRDSIEKNYDNIFKFYHDNCELSEERSEKIINEIYKNSPLEEDYFNKSKKIIFSSKWNNDGEEVFRNIKRIPKEKNGFHCIYFSENCTFDEVVYYLKYKLRRSLRRKTVNDDRVNTKGLVDRCLIGWLTICGLKPKEIEQAFVDVYGYDEIDKFPLIGTIQRNRNRIKKTDWFFEAKEEVKKIFNNNEKLKRFVCDYNEQLHDLYINKNSHQQRIGLLSKKPRFLNLSFDEKKLLFHVKYVK